MTVPSFEAKPVDMDGRAFLAPCDILAYFLGSLGSKANFSYQKSLGICFNYFRTEMVYTTYLSIENGITFKYSETCIKQTPSIKRTVAEVPKFVSLIYFK